MNHCLLLGYHSVLSRDTHTIVPSMFSSENRVPLSLVDCSVKWISPLCLVVVRDSNEVPIERVPFWVRPNESSTSFADSKWMMREDGNSCTQIGWLIVWHASSCKRTILKPSTMLGSHLNYIAPTISTFWSWLESTVSYRSINIIFYLNFSRYPLLRWRMNEDHCFPSPLGHGTIADWNHRDCLSKSTIDRISDPKLCKWQDGSSVTMGGEIDSPVSESLTHDLCCPFPSFEQILAKHFSGTLVELIGRSAREERSFWLTFRSNPN